MGSILATYSTSRLVGFANAAYTKMGATWTGNALWSMPGYDRLIDTLNSLASTRMGEILVKYDLSRLSGFADAAYSRKGASWTAEALWAMPGYDKLIGTLGSISAGRASNLLWQYDWNRIYSVLRRCSSSFAWKMVNRFPISYASKLSVMRNI